MLTSRDISLLAFSRSTRPLLSPAQSWQPFQQPLLSLLRGLGVRRALDQTKSRVAHHKKLVKEGKADINLRRWADSHGFLLQLGSDPSRPHSCVASFVCRLKVGLEQIG